MSGCRAGIYVIGVGNGIIDALCQVNTVYNKCYGFQRSTLKIDAFDKIDNCFHTDGNGANGKGFCNNTAEVAAEGNGYTCASCCGVVGKAYAVISTKHGAVSIQNHLGLYCSAVVEEFGSAQGKVALRNS